MCRREIRTVEDAHGVRHSFEYHFDCGRKDCPLSKNYEPPKR